MTFQIQRAGERYFADQGWLKTYHSFSFADYYDPNNLNWGALRVLNDDLIAPGAGFPAHPHRDMEILTYVLSGELEHQDSMGNRGVVKAGGVQFMSAGTGVRHSEFNARKDLELHLVQMWVLPGRAGTLPTYGQADFTTSERLNRWLDVAAGPQEGTARIVLTADAALRVARLENVTVTHAFAGNRYGFLFVAEGSAEANGEQVGAGDAVRMKGIDTLEVSGNGEILLWDLPEV